MRFVFSTGGGSSEDAEIQISFNDKTAEYVPSELLLNLNCLNSECFVRCFCILTVVMFVFLAFAQRIFI